MNCKRLEFALIVGVPLVLIERTLQDCLVRVEVCIYIFLDGRFLRRVDNSRTALDLLDVSVFRIDQHDAAVVIGAQVGLYEPLSLFVNILGAQRLRDFGEKANRRALLNALDNALILRVQKLHCGVESVVCLAEKVVLVLVLIQNADVLELDRGPVSAAQLVT